MPIFSFISMLCSILQQFKNNHSQIFFKIGVLKNFAIFTGKHMCWSLFLIEMQTFRSLLKRDSNTYVFLWILRNFYKQLFHDEHLSWLLLAIVCVRWVKRKPATLSGPPQTSKMESFATIVNGFRALTIVAKLSH